MTAPRYIVYDKADDEWLGQFEDYADAEDCLADWQSRGKAGYIVTCKPDPID